jgi:hypothetical protein
MHVTVRRVRSAAGPVSHLVEGPSAVAVAQAQVDLRPGGEAGPLDVAVGRDEQGGWLAIDTPIVADDLHVTW